MPVVKIANFNHVIMGLLHVKNIEISSSGDNFCGKVIVNKRFTTLPS